MKKRFIAGRRLLIPSVVAVLVALPLAGVATAGPGPARLAAEAAEEIEPAVMDAVVLVDQSGSLSDEDVARESEAVSAIAQSGLSARSRVTVVGFGSNNGGQSATTTFCPPTILRDSAARQSLADCSDTIARRTAEEGNDTDHAAAVGQAIDVLQQDSPKGAIKAVFFLTDGRLDVRNSPNYGAAQDRNAAAQVQLDKHLATAKDQGIQVWPLGFGAEIDEPALQALAAGGAQGDVRCQAKPQARVVRSSADVQWTLVKAAAGATCSFVEDPDTGKIDPNGTEDLKVSISPLATNGSIIVAKGDPAIKVTYLKPGGGEVTSSGQQGESTYERSGDNTRTDTLSIVNPDPGEWTVRLEAPKGIERQQIGATVVWQGALRTFLVTDPPSPKPGEEFTVSMSLLTRKGRITDADLLTGMSVGVKAQAAGGAETDVPMSDNGKGSDPKGSDGEYTGTMTAPDQEGALGLRGSVTGAGVYNTDVPLELIVAADVIRPQVRFEFDTPDQTWAGETIAGTLKVNNPGETRDVQIQAEDPTGTLQAGVNPGGAFSLPSGDSERDVELSVLPESSNGEAALSVNLVDAAGQQVYGNTLLSVEVRDEPSWIEKNRTLLIALFLLVVLAGLALLVARQARRRRLDVRKLTVLLKTEDGSQFSLKARTGWSDQFSFVIRAPEDLSRRLSFPSPGDAEIYRLRRAARNVVRLRTPQGEQINLQNGKFETLPESPELSIGVQDDRRRVPAKKPRKNKPEPVTPDRGSADIYDGYPGGDDVYGAAADPYGSSDSQGPSGSGRGGRTEKDTDPFGSDSYTGASSVHSSEPYGGDPFGGDPYGGNPGGSDPYSGSSYGSDPYGGDDPYGSRPKTSSGRSTAATHDSDDPYA
ncbi:vWA domain-containing protein [Kineosporia babensis]|uniref:VWA domain-containing protein n=1 Tax=Kineosporia babensis TaxID=499548 RepID=A0A9X1NEX3_9ACTN|nr:vWA domain-containing protein [Kineosporia babensis]MCD5312051.1 VWA domain-containing protein [Kineosporia babensis]